MPIHDWSCVPSGLFHHFHQSWSVRLTDSLNRGLLPPGLAALVEQRAGAREPDVLAIETWNGLSDRTGGLTEELEETYQATWESLPKELRTAVATGKLPDALP